MYGRDSYFDQFGIAHRVSDPKVEAIAVFLGGLRNQLVHTGYRPPFRITPEAVEGWVQVLLGAREFATLPIKTREGQLAEDVLTAAVSILLPWPYSAAERAVIEEAFRVATERRNAGQKKGILVGLGLLGIGVVLAALSSQDRESSQGAR